MDYSPGKGYRGQCKEPKISECVLNVQPKANTDHHLDFKFFDDFDYFTIAQEFYVFRHSVDDLICNGPLSNEAASVIIASINTDPHKLEISTIPST